MSEKKNVSINLDQKLKFKLSKYAESEVKYYSGIEHIKKDKDGYFTMTMRQILESFGEDLVPNLGSDMELV